MVPFIDLLMVTVSFLLVTAVWTSMARMPAETRLPSEKGHITQKEDPPAMQVKVNTDGRVLLQWQKGQKLEDVGDVPLDKVAETMHRAFVAKGQTSATAAVLHVPANMPMNEVTRVMDAIRTPRLKTGENAYVVTFSTT